MAVPLSAKAHFELCLTEQKYYVNARSHCRLAKLYEDFDQHRSDLVELEFQMKWEKVKEAVEVLGRILKAGSSEEIWDLLRKFVLSGLCKESAIKQMFTELPVDLFLVVINGLSKHFGTDSLFMCQLQLFIWDISAEEKYSKIAGQALDFLIDKADHEASTHEGVSVFHVLIAIYLAPKLLQRRINGFRLEQMVTVFTYTVHVAICWRYASDTWVEQIREYIPGYNMDDNNFLNCCWDILRDFLAKIINTFSLGTISTAVNANPSSCEGFMMCVPLLNDLKEMGSKLARFLFVWRSYTIWKEHISADKMLIWLPDNKWNGDVDKIIDDFSEASSSDKYSPPSKRARGSRERKVASVVLPEIHLVPPCEPLDDAYGLCTAAVVDIISYDHFSKCIDDRLMLVKYFPDVHRFISEALIYKLKVTEAVVHLKERVKEISDVESGLWLELQLACAYILARNYAEAFNLLAELVPYSADWSEAEKVFENDSAAILHTYTQQRFCIVKCDIANEFVFDYLHHVLYKVYTSTTLDHENDELLGSLLILSQISFYVQGYKSFNRIMRHIEAKGLLICPGLGKYITNITILEELARIQDFCSEYVSVQIAAPQVQRRIGQSTRHSVRGTRDGQKHCLEEQIRKREGSPFESVVEYFKDNRSAILQILEK